MQILPLDTILQKAIAHHQAGKLQEAEQLYRTILLRQPDHPEANHNLGVLYTQTNRTVESLPYFETALKTAPQQPQHWLSYILTLKQSGKASEAYEILTLWRQYGLDEPSFNELVTQLEFPTTNQPEANQSASLIALYSGEQYAEAEILARKLTELQPLYGLGWQVLGASLKAQGKDCLTAMRKAAELMPEDANSHSNLGVALRDLGLLSEAAESYQRALEINPEFALAHNNLGVCLKDLGCFDDAVASFRRALKLDPNYADAHNNLGITLLILGLPEEAAASCKRTLEIDSGHAYAHNNLANALRELGQPENAAASYKRALELKPDLTEAHNSLGGIFLELGQPENAAASYRRALELTPNQAELHNSLGVALQKTGLADEAATCYRRALELDPDFAAAYGNLGSILKAQGKLDEALACYRQQAQISPENGIALHHIAMLTGSNTERAPTEYVETLFDDYADRFDSHLQQELQYAVPEKLLALIAKHAPLETAKWRTLDLGCGTGLVGYTFALFSRQLVGVDISSKMLGKARERRLYHRLEHLDLLAMLKKEPPHSHDMVIAADVFIYLGKLDEILGEIKRVLSPGGFLIFSVETFEAAGARNDNQHVEQQFKLGNSGRYAHTRPYLDSLSLSNDFSSLELLPTSIRLEHGTPVNGLLAAWQSNERGMPQTF